MSATDFQRTNDRTLMKNFRIWRTIQLASLLPLTLCIAWMFYSQEASGFGIVAFFLILVIGVMFPEMKADIATTNIVIREELAALRQEFQELKAEVRKSLKESCN